MAMIFCYECGKKISDSAMQCPACGAPSKGCKTVKSSKNVSDKKPLPAFLLAWFVGVFGAHRFYVGKTGSAVAMLLISLTLVGLIITGIWTLVDLIMIACGNFTDANGKKLEW